MRSPSASREDETPGFPVAAERARPQLQAAGSSARTALAVRDGEPVAFGFVVPGAAAVRLPGGVLPAAQGLGIGRRLLAWQVAAGPCRRSGSGAPRWAVRQPSVAIRTAALLAHAGFRPERSLPPPPPVGRSHRPVAAAGGPAKRPLRAALRRAAARRQERRLRGPLAVEPRTPTGGRGTSSARGSARPLPSRGHRGRPGGRVRGDVGAGGRPGRALPSRSSGPTPSGRGEGVARALLDGGRAPRPRRPRMRARTSTLEVRRRQPDGRSASAVRHRRTSSSAALEAASVHGLPW